MTTVSVLCDALTLAANRLERLSLELPLSSQLHADVVDWVAEARAVANGVSPPDRCNKGDSQ